MRKNNLFKGTVIAALMLCLGFSARAQQTETSLYVNGVLPVAAFNNEITLHTIPEGESVPRFVPIDNTTIAKGAAVGLGFTARFGVWFDIGFGDLQPFAEASFLWNNSRSYIRNTYDTTVYNNTMDSKPTVPQYFNIPVLLGLKYRYNDLHPDIHPFVEFGIGYDWLFITKNGYPSQTYSYTPSGALGWMMGIGTYLGKFVSVSFVYTGLGNHKIEYSKGSYGYDTPNWSNTNKRNLGELGLRIGFHF